MKCERYLLYHMLSFALSTALLAGAGCKSVGSKSGNPNSANNNAAQPTPTAVPLKRLIKPSGWKIPGLGAAVEFIPPKLLPSTSNGSAQVYASSLSPQPNPASPVTLRSYLSDEELKELGITAKKLHVITIVKFDLDGSPFCYVVKYRSTYTMEGLHYYDEDGDKSFELVETGTVFPDFIPRIPSWAQARK
jgi:hypothetical protein